MTDYIQNVSGLKNIRRKMMASIIVSSSWQNNDLKNLTSFRRKPESSRPARMLHSQIWIPAFAGMTEIDQTMIKAKMTMIQDVIMHYNSKCSSWSIVKTAQTAEMSMN